MQCLRLLLPRHLQKLFHHHHYHCFPWRPPHQRPTWVAAPVEALPPLVRRPCWRGWSETP